LPSIRKTVMERNQLRDYSFNGVLRRIARGVATFVAGLSGADSPQIPPTEYHGNMVLPCHPIENITIPGALDSAYVKTSEIEAETIAKKKKTNWLIFTSFFIWCVCSYGAYYKYANRIGKDKVKTDVPLQDKVLLDGEVMKTLWKELFPDDALKCERQGDIESYIKNELEQFSRSAGVYGIKAHDEWLKTKTLENPNPFVVKLFWKYIEKHREEGCLKKVDFIIYRYGEEYKYGDEDENATKYYIKWVDEVDE